MEMTHAIDYVKKSSFHMVKTSGPMTGDGFARMSEELLAHPHFTANGNVLFDHRDLDFQRVSLDDIQAIRGFHTKNETRIGNGKSAIVVAPHDLETWNRLWSQGKKIKTESRVRLFQFLKDGIDWLEDGDD